MRQGTLSASHAPETVDRSSPPSACKPSCCRRGTRATPGPCSRFERCACHGFVARCPACGDVLPEHGCTCPQGKFARVEAVKRAARQKAI